MRTAILALCCLVCSTKLLASINLQISGGIVPNSMYRGLTYPITIYVYNSGTTSTTTSFFINVSINTASTYNGNQTFLVDIPVNGGIGAGITRTLNTTITIPCSYSTGTRYILAGADSHDTITESSETDNNFPFPFLLKTDTDLIAQSYSTSSSTITSGNSLTANFSVKNLGGTNAGSFNVGFYLSSSSTFDESQSTQIGSNYSISLLTACSQTNSLSKNLTIPNSVCPGTYYIFMWIDNGTSVSEVSDDNNFEYKTIAITGVSSLSAPTTTFGHDSNPTLFTTTTTPTLTWTGSGSKFWLQVSKCPYGPSNIEYSVSCIPGNTHTVPDNNLLPGKLYRWNMYAGYACCSSSQSALSNTKYFNIPPLIVANGPTSFCSGSSVVLQTPYFSDATYQWRLNGNNISGATSTTYTATTSGNYSVVNSFGCGSTSPSNTITVTSGSCCPPTTQASNISFSSVGNNQFKVNWSNGNGSKRMVKINTSNSFFNPVNGSDPSFITTYQNSGEQVVYNGSNDNVTVQGLSMNTTYWVRVYEANCSNNSIQYNTTTTTTNPLGKTTTSGTVPIANFTIGASVLISGQSAYLYDASSLNPTSWNWIIERARANGSFQTVTTSTQKNPVIPLTTSACYRVTLVASNTYGSSSALSGSCFIYVKPNINAIVPPDVVRAQKYPIAFAGDPVNLATGSFDYSMRDIQVPGVRTILTLERRYFSNSEYDGPFGKGWFHSFDIKIDTTNSSDWKVQYPDGHNEHYAPYANGETQTMYAGNFDTLNYATTAGTIVSYTLSQKDGTKWNFNNAGQILAMTDLNGNQTTFSYSSNKLTLVTAPGGRSLQFIYNAFNKVSQVTDNSGRAVQYYYDPTGHYLDSTRIGASKTWFRYDSHGMTEAYDPRGNRIISNLYDSIGRIYKQYDADSNITTYQYNTPLQGITTVTDPYGYAKVVAHDSLSRCIQSIDEVGNITKYGYSTNNTLDTIIDPKNNQTLTFHDSKGNTIKSINAKGYVDSLSYTQFNRIQYVQDKEGNATKTAYDALGNPTLILLATGDTIKQYYNAQGLDTLIVDQRGFKTQKVYNSFGDIIRLITPTSSTQYTYDVLGRLIETADSYGRKDSLFYDYFDQIIRHKDKMGYIEEFGYDLNGNKIYTKEKNGAVTAIEYNRFDKMIRMVDPQNYVSEMVYDKKQQVIKTRDASKNTKFFTYDAVGRLIETADSTLGVLSQSAYDPDGNVVSYRDESGNQWTKRTDEIGRITSVLSPLGDSVQYTYDKNDKTTVSVDEEGKSTNWQYDAIGRHIKTIDATNNALQLYYSKTGQVDSVTDARGNIRFKSTYDGSGRTLTTDDGVGHTVNTWDSTDALKRVVDPDNRTLEYTYNANNELTNIQYGSSSIRHFSLDSAGKYKTASTAAYGDSVVRNQAGLILQNFDSYGNQTQYSYDGNDNITKIIYPGGKAVEYTYSSLNKCIKVKDWNNKLYIIDRYKDGKIRRIVYPNGFKTLAEEDELRRIKSWININDTGKVFQSNVLKFSKVSNILNDSGIHILPFIPVYQSKGIRTFSASDEIIDAGDSTTFTYTKSGQRSELKKLSNTSYTYKWSLMGELDSTTDGGLFKSYTYNALGGRVGAKVIGAEKRFVVSHELADFPIVLQQRSSTNQEQIKYLFIPDDGILLSQDSAGTIRYFHHSLYGNTVALSDTNRRITDRYEYSLTDDTFYHAGPSYQPFTWMGMYGIQHEGNNLFYVHARYYDGKTGTFISRDANVVDYQNTQDLDRYTIEYNNQLKYIDPSGMSSVNNISCENLQTFKQIKNNQTLSFKQKTMLIWNLNWKNLPNDVINGLNYTINTAFIQNKEAWKEIAIRSAFLLMDIPSSKISNGANVALKPLGLYSSTGRIIPKTIKERLIMEEIVNNPLLGREIKITLNDPKFEGWKKMTWNNAGVEIHYVAEFIDGVLSKAADFKFK